MFQRSSNDPNFFSSSGADERMLHRERRPLSAVGVVISDMIMAPFRKCCWDMVGPGSAIALKGLLAESSVNSFFSHAEISVSISPYVPSQGRPAGLP